MFLTSAAGLLHRTEKWVWIPGGLRPLRRHAPVSGINKTADGRKLNRQHERMLQGLERVIAKALLQLIHSPSLTPLASCLLSLQNTCCVQALSLTFPNIDPPAHLRPYDWTVFLSRLEDYLKSCRVADLYRFMCFYLFLFFIWHWNYSQTLIITMLHWTATIRAAVYLCLSRWSSL